MIDGMPKRPLYFYQKDIVDLQTSYRWFHRDGCDDPPWSVDDFGWTNHWYYHCDSDRFWSLEYVRTQKSRIITFITFITKIIVLSDDFFWHVFGSWILPVIHLFLSIVTQSPTVVSPGGGLVNRGHQYVGWWTGRTSWNRSLRSNLRSRALDWKMVQRFYNLFDQVLTKRWGFTSFDGL